MDPAAYHAWYGTSRGLWIGETEYRLTSQLLQAQPGDTLLDVGCGTGWFTRRFAGSGLVVTGLDRSPHWLTFARGQGPAPIAWVEGDACRIPFRDRSFDRVVSIAALCFMDHERQAVAEVVRVTRRRFAIGWLNRTSLLYGQKGRSGGCGAYRGARWHRPQALRDLFAGLPVRGLRMRSAVFLPSGTASARIIERVLPGMLPWGALLVVTGDRV